MLDANIKNHIATSILHIHSFDRPVTKICHQAVNVTTTEAELFAIRCSINQAVGIQNIQCIIVITDSLHAAKKIFNLSSYSYQIYIRAISCELREFFHNNTNNHIEFWGYPSKEKWYLYLAVDKDSKSFPALVSFPSISS